jgi:uncharacterized protein (DUF433 family)
MQEPNMKWQDHITVDPAVCHGKPCIKGTRVMVSVVLDNLAAGETADQIATDYGLAATDVQAVPHYAATLGRSGRRLGQQVELPTGTNSRMRTGGGEDNGPQKPAEPNA